MRDAQTVPRLVRSHATRTLIGAYAVMAGFTSCVPVQHQTPDLVELLLIPAAVGAPAGLTPVFGIERIRGRVPLTPQSTTALEFLRMDVPRSGSWIATRTALAADSFPYSTRGGVLAFGGRTRDAAAVLRVLHADTGWRRRAAADLRRVVGAGALRVLVIVPAGVTSRESDALFLALAELAAGARAGGVAEVLAAVAGADTTAYPSRPLAAVADALLISMEPTASAATPGAPYTVEHLRRTVGLRGSEVGRGRLVLLLPVHGYVWMRDSLPRAISFTEGTRLAAGWRVPLVRDAASETLFARAAGRGELWVPDGRVAARLAREARAMGVRRFAVVLGAGEDPALADSLAAGLQSTSSSR